MNKLLYVSVIVFGLLLAACGRDDVAFYRKQNCYTNSSNETICSENLN